MCPEQARDAVDKTFITRRLLLWVLQEDGQQLVSDCKWIRGRVLGMCVCVCMYCAGEGMNQQTLHPDVIDRLGILQEIVSHFL